MSLSKRVHQHSWISSVVTANFALAVAACMGASPARVATSYPSPASAAPAAEGWGGPSHAAMEPRGEPAPDRPGLGTSWGESVEAPITFTSFERQGPAPWAEVMFHYNDATGVAEHARYLGAQLAPLELYAGAGALSVAVVDDDGRALPGFTAAGRTLIMGHDGARYKIVVHNQSAARFEVVTSVDGLDVIDGQPADPNRRGYLINPHGDLTIDGFRTSNNEVAAFRFGKVADSYAAQTSGDRNVGVIGMAIFSERGAAWSPDELGRRDSADPFPQRGYAAPPR
jgi:hypothetical protein